MELRTKRKLVFFLYIIFFINGVGTLFFDLPFPIELAPTHEDIVSITSIVLAVVFLVMFYVLKTKEKTT